MKKLDACHSKGLKNMRRVLLSCFSNDKHVLNLKPSYISKLHLTFSFRNLSLGKLLFILVSSCCSSIFRFWCLYS